MRAFEAVMVLADISGYTRFVVMHRASIFHAEQIVSELLESVTEHASYPLKVHKLEGDAAFMTAEITGTPQECVNDVARQVIDFMDAFQNKQTELFDKSVGGRSCSACQGIENLRLKTIIHMGEVLEKQVSGLTELAGEPVILLHRLLKNSVGENAYLLATDSVRKKLDFEPYPRKKTYRETIEDIGSVAVTAFFPPGEALDRQGVPPLSRFPGRIEALRLFAARVIAKVSGKGRAFRNLPV